LGLGAGLGTGLSASLGAGTVVKVAAVGLLVGGAGTSGETLLAHAEGLFASSQGAAARAPASPSAKPSPGRVVAGLPTERGPRKAVPTLARRSNGPVPHRRLQPNPTASDGPTRRNTRTRIRSPMGPHGMTHHAATGMILTPSARAARPR
jgi:hypothetical protein